MWDYIRSDPRPSLSSYPPTPHTFLLLGNPSHFSHAISTPMTLRCTPLTQASLSSRSLYSTACCPLTWLVGALPPTCPLNLCHESHHWYSSNVLFLKKWPKPEIWQSFLATTILPPKSTHCLLSISTTMRPSHHLPSVGVKQYPSFFSFSFRATSL